MVWSDQCVWWSNRYVKLSVRNPLEVHFAGDIRGNGPSDRYNSCLGESQWSPNLSVGDVALTLLSPAVCHAAGQHSDRMYWSHHHLNNEGVFRQGQEIIAMLILDRPHPQSQCIKLWPIWRRRVCCDPGWSDCRDHIPETQFHASKPWQVLSGS
jgi:hypothetical protein